MHRASPYSLLLAIALLAPACGGDDSGDGDDGTSGVDAGDGGGGADASAECVETDVLPAEYRPVASVSSGAVTATPEGDVTVAVIDATAGGMMGQAENPYLYIDLAAGTKVEIDDVAALTSSDWDVAFKRPSIRINGGDSGPGEVAHAVVEADSLDKVTEAPADAEFGADDWVSDGCEFQRLPGGEPNTAFGEWYDYDDMNHTLTPKGEVHVLRSRSGDLFKLAIESYYADEADPTRGGVYQVSWAPL